MSTKQYCLPLFDFPSTTPGLTNRTSCSEMAKPVKKVPTLFDGIDPDAAPEPIPAQPQSFAERVRPKSLFDCVPEPVVPRADPVPETVCGPPISSGEKSKARDILAAIRTLQVIEKEKRPATPDEKQLLARYCGPGPVALSIFPNPATGQYKDATWKALGDELKVLLSEQEYDSAKRTTFNAFYTSPTVISAMHSALTRLGVADDSLILEPGCGIGNFLLSGKRYLGIEMDSISSRIARALHPDQDIRHEDFRDSRLPVVDAVIGNVPFADLKLEYKGQRYALHDYFFAKSVDALAPGGVLALVTSHYMLDKQNAAIREYLASKADFLGAIRLPSDAFKREGTAVVTDIVILQKREPGQEPKHVDPDWLKVQPIDIEGRSLPLNRYFLNHPEQILGTMTPQDPAFVRELNRLLDQVDRARCITLGHYRGLSFGLEVHSGGAVDVFLAGQTFRSTMLNAQSQGPRAVMNALVRLADSYAEVNAKVNQDREVAQRQLEDYQARIGRPFAHAAYLEKLTALRDRLKTALSRTPAEGEPTTGELANAITTLRASHQVEAAPMRIKPTPQD